MQIAVDIDGTVDAAPHQFERLLSALRAAGHYVIMLSGSGNHPPSGNSYKTKCNYLSGLGLAECWDELVIVTGDVAQLKAQWCQDNNIHVLIDNSKSNAEAASKAGVALVLVPWATRIAGEK